MSDQAGVAFSTGSRPQLLGDSFQRQELNKHVFDKYMSGSRAKYVILT